MMRSPVFCRYPGIHCAGTWRTVTCPRLSDSMPAPPRGDSWTYTHARRRCRRWSRGSTDLDRSRKVCFRKTARKPAPMLVLDRLTVKVTGKVCGAAASVSRINSLEGSLVIEWD